MEAKELRIGNWVNLYGDYDSQVTGLTNTKKVWCVNNPHDENCAWETTQIKPIPLTEEWLLKFGFDDGINDYLAFCRFKKGNFVVVREQDIYSYPYEDYEGNEFDLELKHIHQLQNLYHSLTGNELTLQLYS